MPRGGDVRLCTFAETRDAMLVKELVYEILDEVHSISDDSLFTEDHVVFLIKKCRAWLLKKERDKEKESEDSSSEFEYQSICLDLEQVEAIPGLGCEGHYLRSTKAVPKLLEGTTATVYPIDYWHGINIVLVSRSRMRYVGTNPWLRNIIWCAIGPDMHLYFTGANSQFLNLRKIRLSGIFEDFDEASELSCDTDGGDTSCDVLDSVFPIRDYLVPALIQTVVKELTGAMYRPADLWNNSNDELKNVGGGTQQA